MSARAVIVTGGSGGIGGAVATAAAKAGWFVYIGYKHRRQRAETLAAELQHTGLQARAIELPLDDPGRVVLALDEIDAERADVRAIVLCASPRPLVVSFLKTTPVAFREQFETSVIGNHALIAEVWKRFFRPRRDGHVIAMLSAALGPPVSSHLLSYVVAKSALATLLDGALREFGNDGFRVTTISPGFTETEMLSAFPAAIIDRARASARGGRFDSPDEVAIRVVDVLEGRSSQESRR